MSLDALLSELYSMTYSGRIKPGLERISALCAAVGNPHRRLNAIHVAGTNGKGSTSALLASILQSAGYCVGLYTSPHIRAFNERLRINGTTIDDADIMRLAQPLMSLGKEIGATFFEITTAMAFQWFAERRVDVAVIETGLGGRLDATNVISPLLSIITQIDYDHQEYLGTSITDIAGEKAGIIKEGAPVVVAPQSQRHGESVAATIRAVFEKRAALVGSAITFAEDVVHVETDSIRPDLTMNVSVLNNDVLRYYDVGLAGIHQTGNVASVLSALPHLRDILFFDESHVRSGLANVVINTGIEGRIQLIRTTPTVVLDVSHNPGGIRALCNTLRSAGYPDHSWHVVFGAMMDKDISGMLNELHPLVSTLHLCTPTFSRAATTEALNQIAQSIGYGRISTHTSVASAVDRSLLRGPTIICGSFHVADEAIAQIRNSTSPLE